MVKKRYPIISIIVAVVWAAFFYPPDRVPQKQQAVSSAKPPMSKAQADAVKPMRTATR